MNICQKCGDQGVLNDLIYCVDCKVSAEHRYCLDVMPKSKKEKVVWKCEECNPKDTKIGPVPSRKSDRITQAAEVRLSRKELRKQTSFSSRRTNVHVGRSPETKQPKGDCSVSNEEFKRLPYSDETVCNQELRKKRRRLIQEDSDASDGESREIKSEASQSVPTIFDGLSNSSCNFLPLESSNNVHSRPAVDPIWRGCFKVNGGKVQTSVGLVARLTGRACPKLVYAASVLPLWVPVEILSKSDVWPQRFQISPPTVDGAALYFFPEYESDERAFDSILDDMIDHNLALKAVIKDQQLLVFSSRELPPDHWRICRKYYWWGVFEPINHIVRSGDTKCATTTELTHNLSRQEQNDLNKLGNCQSPHSPLSLCSYTSDPRGSIFHP
ncbi:hypothetical protein CISIN_1g0167792mg [Citrus sinensis]|uniref:AIPP2-like SPOC-like domain-containing protein n=1 Tax=Citrus sinensis TaxID=2711 RepID=A0A067ET67_CITSI|nr:hypothetical protein CISIN_1g0167792mg [Citrus sinensis]